jgi:hypothetical protein
MVERRSVERPDPSTSGRCGFCGSRDTYVVVPESFQEWALVHWGDAALLRCHDCGRRQAVSGLGPSRRGEWSLGVGLLKLFGWAVLVGGLAVALLVLFRRTELGPSEPAPFNLPREQRRPSPNAPAPSPSSGPFSFRSTPTNAG